MLVLVPMSQDRLVILRSKSTGEHIHVRKSKAKKSDGTVSKLKMMKYSQKLRKKVEFTEAKK